MSHYAVSKIKIENPEPQTFEEALQKVAEKLGGKVAKNVTVRGWSFTKQCDYAILVNLPYGNGYGIELVEDGIKVHVDDHGAPLTAEEFAQEVVYEYTKLALQQTLQELGYAVEVDERGRTAVLRAYEGW